MSSLLCVCHKYIDLFYIISCFVNKFKKLRYQILIVKGCHKIALLYKTHQIEFYL